MRFSAVLNGLPRRLGRRGGNGESNRKRRARKLDRGGCPRGGKRKRNSGRQPADISGTPRRHGKSESAAARLRPT